MSDTQALKESILIGTMAVFNRKGLKFTMDDLAHELGMSKKTIYMVYRDKEAMFLNMVDFLFDGIARSKQQVLEDTSLGTVDKIRKLLGVMPDSYQNVDFRQLYSLKDKYPAIYKKVEEKLESGWEAPLALIEQGIAEGVIRPISIPLVKLMMESSLEQFFQRDILLSNGLDYNEALNQVVGIIVDGIAVK